MSNQSTFTRNYTLDLIRVCAMCLVVLLHASSVFVSYSEEVTLTGNILNSLSRPCVPLFVMLSGALLLNETKQKDAKAIYKSAGQMLLLTIVWASLYALLFEMLIPIVTNKTINVLNFTELLIKGFYHMWYMYMLIGLYAAVPFLRSFVKKENKHLVLIFIGISLLTVFTGPIIDLLANANEYLVYISLFLDQFYLQFFAGYVTYFLAGWYIVHIGISKRLKYILYTLSMLSLIGTILLLQQTGDYLTVHSNFNLLIFIYSVGLFVFLNDIPVKVNAEKPSFLLFLSKISFGVYMIHAAIDVFVGEALSFVGNPALHIAARFGIVLVVSVVACAVMTKIPLIKKLLRQ